MLTTYYLPHHISASTQHTANELYYHQSSIIYVYQPITILSEGVYDCTFFQFRAIVVGVDVRFINEVLIVEEMK